jgi:hypothetical protein
MEKKVIILKQRRLNKMFGWFKKRNKITKEKIIKERYNEFKELIDRLFDKYNLQYKAITTNYDYKFEASKASVEFLNGYEISTFLDDPLDSKIKEKEVEIENLLIHIIKKESANAATKEDNKIIME